MYGDVYKEAKYRLWRDKAQQILEIIYNFGVHM